MKEPVELPGLRGDFAKAHRTKRTSQADLLADDAIALKQVFRRPVHRPGDSTPLPEWSEGRKPPARSD
jgi:hypothetical protein